MQLVADCRPQFFRLFNSERYSDVTLFLGPDEVKFKAHYAVLGVRTTYFDKAKEHGFKEGETNEYRFPDYSAHALWRVLQYFYTGDYSVEPNQIEDGGGKYIPSRDAVYLGVFTNSEIDDDFELAKHPRVYAIADLLDMKGLQKLCASRFEKQLAEHWISDTFSDAVREVYATTYSNDRAMRDPLVKIAYQNVAALYLRSDFVKLAKELAEFSGDLIAAVISGGGNLS